VKSSLYNWIKDEPYAYAIPSILILDKTVNFLTRSSIVALRIFLKRVIGRTRTDKILIHHKIGSRVYISFSFYLFIFLYKIIRNLRLGNSSLVKINVPKYNYKVYCPATELDYSHMTTREEDILEHFQPKQGDTVVDVGAHLGRYALISSNRVGKEGKVIAIEANPAVFEKLNKNLKLNQVTNTTSLNYAVYSEKTKMKLFLLDVSNDTYHAGNTIMRDRYNLITPTEESSLEVNANTLDNILTSVGLRVENINWIKIDVEGAELEVLKGAHNILSTSKDISILIEVHHLDENKHLFEDIMKLLKNYGFKLKFERIHVGGERHIIVTKEICD
jgi:FkbM family methyltransferase